MIEMRGVDELHFAFACGHLPVGDDPNVGSDAGVVEKLLGKRDQSFEQIVFQNVPADFTFAAAGIAGEERRAVHDDRDA
jgi:hypothetical protein